MSGKHFPNNNLTDVTWLLGLTRLHELLKVVPAPEITSLGDGSEVRTLGQYLARDENVFTLIAPSDKAFSVYEKSNPGLFDSSKPTGREQLRDLMHYHMVEGRFDLDQILSRNLLTSFLRGIEIPIRLEKTALFLGNGQVTQVDNTTKNGVIHIVDSVLVPDDGWSSEDA